MIKTLLFGLLTEVVRDIAGDAEMRAAVKRGVKRAYRKRSREYSACPHCDGTGYVRRERSPEDQRPTGTANTDEEGAHACPLSEKSADLAV